MDNCAMPIGISALACAIAQQIDNTAELTLLASVLGQISDTLGTIVAARQLCESKREKSENLERTLGTEIIL